MCWVLEMDYVGFGTQNLNEFFEIINEVPGSLIESKTSFWSKYSNRIQDRPGNIIIIKYVNCKLSIHKISPEGEIGCHSPRVAAMIACLRLELSHQLHDKAAGVLLMLGVAEVQVSREVLVNPGGQVVAGF